MDFRMIRKIIMNNLDKKTKEIICLYPKDLYEYRHNPTEIKVFHKIYELLQIKTKTRCIHPVWFFIFIDDFKKIGVKYKIDCNNIVQIYLPPNLHVPHKKQILETVRIYSSIFFSDIIMDHFADKTSLLITQFPFTKDFFKSFLFPYIEKETRTNTRLYKDLSYEFNGIGTINIELNEEHHKVNADKRRAREIYYFYKEHIIQHYYDSNDSSHNLLKVILQSLTRLLFKKDKNLALAFHVVNQGIINDIKSAIIFYNLKDFANNKTLTWYRFKEICNQLKIVITDDFLNELKDEINIEEYFYNILQFDEINDETLLTITGCDCLLMSIRNKHSKYSSDIKIIYSKYKNEYDKLIISINTELSEGEEMVRNYKQEEFEINSLTKIIIKWVLTKLSTYKSDSIKLVPEFPFLLRFQLKRTL